MAQAILSALALLVAAAWGQTTEFENRRIVDIQLTPTQALDRADLARVLPLKPGDPLRADDVAAAIDALFATGRFRDIVAEAEPSAAGVVLRFVTQLAWFVGSVSAEGKVASPPNRAHVIGITQLSLGAAFQDEDLTRAQSAIADLLKSNGLLSATVTPEVKRDPDAQEVFITCRIAEHQRARFDTPVLEGQPLLPDTTIFKATGWRLPIVHWWRQVTAAGTRAGVQGVLSKYHNQDRLKARVVLEKLDYETDTGRVRPTLHITPGPRVKVQALESSVSRGTLKRYVPIFQERAVDNDLLAEGKRNLVEYFQNQGYYDVDIDFRALPEQNDLQTVEYVIARGQRYKVARISIGGNRYFPSDVIRERMYMQPASFTMRRGRYSEAFQRKDEESIAELYRSNGFRDVKVTCLVDRNAESKTGQIAVTMHINEGAQWTVETLTLNGVVQVNRDEVLHRLASVEGQPFADLNLASDRSATLTYYYERGFPAAEFTAAWSPADAPHRVNVTYTVKEGDRNFVRRVITSGLSATRRSLVDKKITLKPGDPLSATQEVEIQKHFYDLGIFARVDTAIQNPDGADNHKYVLYDFEEANRYSIGIGVGAQVARFGTPKSTSLSAPGGATGFSPEVSLDLSRLNFLGIGHLVGLHALYSNLEKRYSLTYEIPRFMDVEGRDLRFLVLDDNSLNVRTFASKREEASVQLAEKLSKSLGAKLRFAYRRVSVSSVVIPVLLVPQLQQPVRIGIVSGTLTQDRRDDVTDPHRGIYNTADLGLAGSFFGSQRSFGRILLRNATYHRVTRTVVFARQTQLGVIRPFSPPAGISAQEAVPLPERFFGGGPDTLRAFPYNQAGPRDTGAPLVAGGPASPPTGFPLGGNALFYNNLELRFPLIGSNINGVLFHDMGNVFSSLSNISFGVHQPDRQHFDYTVHAAGFGIRYRTPVGPIRLDLAYSINPPSFYGFNGTPVQLLQCSPGVTATTGPCATGLQHVSHFQFFFSIGQTF
jgi:outer membrane protein assembly complex protein YaeT